MHSALMTFAFSPYRWDDFIHLQLLSLQWLPLTLWSLVRFERERRPATLGAVFVFAALLAGSSGYWAVLAAMAGGVTLLHFLVRKKSRGAVLGTADFGDDLVWGIDRKGRVVDEVPGWPKRLYSRASSGWDGLR